MKTHANIICSNFVNLRHLRSNKRVVKYHVHRPFCTITQKFSRSQTNGINSETAYQNWWECKHRSCDNHGWRVYVLIDPINKYRITLDCRENIVTPICVEQRGDERLLLNEHWWVSRASIKRVMCKQKFYITYTFSHILISSFLE
jgi:hypothetical protein